MMLSSEPSAARFVRVAKASRLIRLTGVVRILRVVPSLSRMLRQLNSAYTILTLRILGLFTAMLWMCHLTACIRHAIGMFGPSDTGDRWADVLNRDDSLDRSTAGPLYSYTTAFHWAAIHLTGGSMDVIPANSFERSFSILCLIFGVVLCGSIISSLSSKLVEVRL